MVLLLLAAFSFRKQICLLVFRLDFIQSKQFSKKAWSQKSVKAVKKIRFVYSCLHLLTILGEDSIESYQFLKGQLSSPIIFHFLKTSLTLLIEKYRTVGKKLVLILDNSPMNHSRALKNFAFYTKIRIFYTPPYSSFVNPVETTYAFIKNRLRQIFSISE